jgi:hypothetical protein
MKWIDVRGAWPCYFDGMRAVELVGARRDITVAQAEIWIATFVR